MSKKRTKHDRKDKKRKPAGPTLTQAQEELLGDIAKVKKVIESLKTTTTAYKDTLKKVRVKYNCLQFQLIGQDLESVLLHIEDLEKNGPKPEQREVSIEESEMKMTEEEDKQLRAMLDSHAEVVDINSAMSDVK